MRRNSLICRLGQDDLGKISVIQTDSLVSEINFVSGQKRLGFGLGRILDELRSNGLMPNEVAVDLVILAALIYLADTRVNRATGSQDGWTREIDLYVPVSNAQTWSSINGLLVGMTNFLTGDKWRLFFRSRSDRFKAIVRAPRKKAEANYTCACLLSGGLDSFIGATNLLASRERPIFVSHYWDGMTSDYQGTCVRLLAKRFGEDSHLSVRARVGFGVDALGNSEIEQTQRSRSFLFFALGTLAASGMEQDTILHVPENGFISLNVPLDPLRLGALSTRTTHPFFMARWGELLSQLGLRVTLLNSYRHSTKGQMVASCKDKKFLRANAHKTMSCSSPTKSRWLGEGPRHCGYCVPCIIRRAALLEGLGNDTTLYSIENLADKTLDSTKSVGQHIRSFQVTLRRVLKNPACARLLIHKPGPLVDFPGELGSYEKVYLDGLKEVGKLLDGVKVRPL